MNTGSCSYDPDTKQESQWKSVESPKPRKA